MNHPRLFFLHLEKCAGMTLHAVIERQYAPEEIYTVPSVSWNNQNFRHLREEWKREAKARLRIVKGHMNYGWHEAFPGEPFEYITILRHPVERVLSLYSFIGEWHPDYGHKLEGLNAFLRRAESAHNDMTFRLSGGMGRGARAFVRAWQNLSTFAVVGTVEFFDCTLQTLRARYGWPPEAYDRQNPTPDRLRELPARLERELLVRNQYDLMLYAYAIRKHGHDL